MQVGARQREFIELRKQAQTEDKTVERSFLHVLDCCEAVSLTLQWLFQQQHVCEAFNIAGEAISIQQLLNEISSVTGTEIKTVDADVYPYAELDQVAADISKAKEVLGWQPKRSIQQMLEDEWRFYQHTLRGQ